MPRSTAREVLNELKWRLNKDFGKVEVHYVHRGAPGDMMVLKGTEIMSLDQLFFHTETATIPYHRIFLITYESEEVFRRDGAWGRDGAGDADGGTGND